MNWRLVNVASIGPQTHSFQTSACQDRHLLVLVVDVAAVHIVAPRHARCDMTTARNEPVYIGELVWKAGL